MSRRLPLLVVLLAAALPVAPALGQQAPRPKPGEKAADRPARAPAAPVIACPSVANYRMLMQGGLAAAAATLADPKADHLGCAALPRGRIGPVVDRVTLAGRSYDCAAVKDTTACHWVEAGTLPAGGAAGWR
ncbi:hypothetical protein [Methylobacterium sp. J-076]|uniref:hypothetical protein n=1 Tax=Methylobacterium sp. J-076 TaxID=2836655 RepID=UPI001FBA00ED|nr:hypothetical protein [Methylobacterium sp. J-076]MCJ2011719.1 hypothetical protein [Methylobacterium sp. J-076]